MATFPASAMDGLPPSAYPIILQAQLEPTASSYLVEWKSAIVVMTNRSDSSIRCVIRLFITKGDKILARTRVPASRIFTLTPYRSLRVHMDTILSDIIITEDPLHQNRIWLPLADTGSLQVCIHVTDSLGRQHYAAPECRSIEVYRYRLPIPLTPAGDDTVDTRTLHFRWLPVYPERSGTSYLLRCYQLPDTLIVAQAIRIQQPVLERYIDGNTHFTWMRPRLIPGRYTWSVQAIDAATFIPIASSDGFSEWVTFVVANKRHIRHRRNVR